MYIAGVDEAGRGPLAGPVIAAVVILNPKSVPLGIQDSKTLTEAKRERLYELIIEQALAYAIGRAEVHEIDSLNILQATLLAMQRAVQGLLIEPTEVWVDGNQCPKLRYPVKAIVQGDKTVPAISAASILAKVTRDREMILLDKKFPGYNFAVHKGYPTKSHCELLNKLGISPIHRLSFGPVKRLLATV